MRSGSRSIGVVVTAGALLVAGSSAALAHGELRPDRVGPGSTTQLDLFLPVEREGARTARVVLAMPRGFTARDCEEPVGWTCAVAPDAVEWRDVARVRAEDHFFFTATASITPGTYTLPVQQTYDDGSESVFAGPPGSQDEAPVLTVSGPGRPSPTARPAPTAAPPGPRTPAPGRPSSPAPGATAAAGPTTSAPSDVVSPAPTPPPAVGLPSAFARPPDLPRGERVTAPGGGDGGPPWMLLGLGALVLGGAVAALRLRRGRA